jgi:hypothetical protein
MSPDPAPIGGNLEASSPMCQFLQANPLVSIDALSVVLKSTKGTYVGFVPSGAPPPYLLRIWEARSLA